MRPARLLAVACLLFSGCAAKQGLQADFALVNADYLPETNATVEIESLSRCTRPDDTRLALSTREPLTVIVHGCRASMGQFRSLADVYAFHGQQTVCFNYDDRVSLEKSSAELIAAIGELAAVLDVPDITIVGHSQGGLVVRRAFIEERPDRFAGADVKVSLATISAPFGGIEAAAHCGSKVLKWLSFGLTKPICRIVTGAKYKEIPPNSEFINDPGRLSAVVERHLKIATDESGTCRRYNRKGRCVEDDFVFSLEEQSQEALQADPELVEVTAIAGHAEIVGGVDTTPTKLIAILQQHGLMRPTPPERKTALARLLADLYLRDTLASELPPATP